MSTFTVDLSDAQVQRLKEMSARFGIAPEELVRVSIGELLTRPQEDCEKAIDYVVKKNAELYRRLS